MHSVQLQCDILVLGILCGEQHFKLQRRSGLFVKRGTSLVLSNNCWSYDTVDSDESEDSVEWGLGGR